jgi:hypothetical protein
MAGTTLPRGCTSSLFARLARRCRGWFGAAAPRAARRHTARPALEVLEGREVPTVTYGGGGVLPNVEVQNVYYGSDWYNNPTYYQQTGALDAFSKSIVNSSYMDMLNNAGYGVGRGTATQGTILLANVNKNYYLTDSQIRQSLQSMISNNQVAAPDANRVYVVYVEDNVAVMNDHDNNSTSQSNFLGYHMAFAGTDASGRPADVHYAVVTYPGGSVGNGQVPNMSTFDSLTAVTSHELSEAVTDPNIRYKGLGWYDAQKGEIGDIVAGQCVYLNGYAVQKESDKNDQAMSPVGAAARQQTSFVLQSGGQLWMHTAAGWTNLGSGISVITNQGIDNSGRAMVDAVTTSGVAEEYHEGIGWVSLTTGAKGAFAGNGESYVLMNNGDLWEYRDASRQWTFLDHNVAALGAGTDRYGVSMVDVLYTSGVAYEYSDTSGWHYLARGVRQVSAGRNGYSGVLLNNGNAYSYSEATGSSWLAGTGVAEIAEGTDASGNLMIDLVQNNGTAWEWHTNNGWTELGTGVKAVSKGCLGVTGVLFQNGNAYQHSSGGWTYLTGNVIEVM